MQPYEQTEACVLEAYSHTDQLMKLDASGKAAHSKYDLQMVMYPL